MNFDMTKVANVILYMLHKKVKNLNDKKTFDYAFFNGLQSPKILW